MTTPLMTAEEVVTLLAGETESVRDAEIRGQIGLTFMSELYVLEAVDVTDMVLVRSVDRRQVHYATGDSDAESVRDWDSGPGTIRWAKRPAYFFRRENNDNEVRWRRRVKPVVKNRDEADWPAENESDEMVEYRSHRW